MSSEEEEESEEEGEVDDLPTPKIHRRVTYASGTVLSPREVPRPVPPPLLSSVYRYRRGAEVEQLHGNTKCMHGLAL